MTKEGKEESPRIRVDIPLGSKAGIWLGSCLAASVPVLGTMAFEKPAKADPAPMVVQTSPEVMARMALLEERLGDLKSDVSGVKADVSSMKDAQLRILTEIRLQREAK